MGNSISSSIEDYREPEVKLLPFKRQEEITITLTLNEEQANILYIMTARPPECLKYTEYSDCSAIHLTLKQALKL